MHTHLIEEGTARHLLTTVGLTRPAIGGAAVLAVSESGEALTIHRERDGYTLEGPSGGNPAESWPDAFGVNPYRPGHVALTVGPRSTWARAKARALLIDWAVQQSRTEERANKRAIRAAAAAA